MFVNEVVVGRTEAQSANPSSRQRGATLAEIVMVLAVIAVIIFGAFSLFGNAFGGSKAQSEVTNIQGIVSGVNSIYGTQRNYASGSLIPALIAAKAAPSAMVVPGVTTSLRNSYGGPVTVTGGDDRYYVTTNSVPKRGCIDLAQTSFGSVDFTINGASAAAPSTPNDAINACNQDQNTLSWAIR